MSCGIYKITNLINGHSYIGQSINIERRWRSHRSYNIDEVGHKPLYRAFKKYGLSNFSFTIIEECDINILNQREQYWISYYDTYNNGYNLTTGGDGTPNVIVKLTNIDILEIIELLQNSKLTQREISRMFNVGEDTISEINCGKTRRLDNIQYPIRNYKIAQSKKICPLCGGPKDKASQLCHQCLIEQLRKDRPNRETLKQLIRTTPFTTIGKRYNVSDNTIRRWCDTYNLPKQARKIKQYSDEEWELI